MATPLPEDPKHYTGYGLPKDNSRAKRADLCKRIGGAAELAARFMSPIRDTSRLVVTAARLDPNSPSISHEAAAGSSLIYVASAVSGLITQVFNKKVADQSNFGEKAVGDKSGAKIAKYGIGRHGFRFAHATIGVAGAVTAYTGASQLAGRALQAAGSLCSVIAMAFYVIFAGERVKNLDSIRELVKTEGGIDKIRLDITTITPEEEEELLAKFSTLRAPDSEDLFTIANKTIPISKRGVVPKNLRIKYADNAEMLKGIELFLIAKREHYVRFIGETNVRRILGDPKVKLEGVNPEKLLQKEVLDTLKLNSTIWKVVRVLAVSTAIMGVALNFATAGASELILGIINLGIAIGWTIVDSYFFIKDYRDGKYSKDQLVAHIFTQLAILTLAIGSTIVSPLSSFFVQTGLISAALLGIGYSIVRDVRRRCQASQEAKLMDDVKDIGPDLEV
ncbi:MAG: hypothetical protein ACOYK9_05295 [Chlamydiia bacterium]